MKQVLNVFSYLLSVRNFFVATTVVLLLAPVSLNWLSRPNTILFWAGANLAREPQSATQIAKILISQSEMDRLIKDMPGALGIGNILQGLKGVFTKGVLLVVDELPNTENYATDVLVSRLVNDNTLRESLQASGLLSDIEALGMRRDNYYSQVLDGSLLLGIAQSNVAKDKINYLRESTIIPVTKPDETLITRIISFFKPSTFLLTKFRYESRTSGYPAYSNTNETLAYPLLWRAGDHYFPDAILALHKKVLGGNPVTRGSQLLSLGDTSIPLSEGDVIYPMYSSRTGLQAKIDEYSLADLKNPADYGRFHNKVVIIGVKDNQQFADIAAAYYSLDTRAYYTVPAWYLWAEKGALVFLLLYLFLIVPRLRINLGLMVSAFLAVGLLVTQIGLQISQMQWLPVGLLLSYLLIGHLFALLWMLQKNLFSASTNSGAKTNKRTNTILKQKPREEPHFPATKSDSIFTRTLAIKPQKLTLGRYQIDSELGRGAMGVVYLGHDPSIDRKVAIKTLNYEQFPADTLDEVKERFFREAKAAGNLKHQNIVTVYEMAEDTERAFIAMEYVGGKPLSAYTKKGNLLPVEEVYEIVIHVAEALGYAHENNVVHRDIKPSNILYDRDRGEVKVADFGIARITDNASTKTGDILGSPLYMSPEQIKGEKVSGQSDIFSLGVTFYQLLTGELPFNGDSMVAITHQIVNGKYTAVTDINSELPDSAQRIIARALQKNPEKRFESAYEMSDMLQKYLSKN